MNRKYYNKKPICRTCLKHDPRIAKPNHKLSDNEWSIVKSREKNLSKSRNDIKNKASFELGFNPETHISIPNHFTPEFLSVPNKPQKQRCAIIIDQSMINTILKSKKLHLKDFEQTYKINNSRHKEKISYYASETKFGTICFAYVESIKKPKDEPQHFSISLYILLNGKEPFEVLRYDSKTKTHHQRFKNGKITQDIIVVESPHIHKYDEIFTAVFPDSFCHYDVEVLGKEENFESIIEQSLFLKDKWDLQPSPEPIQQEEQICTYLQRIKNIKKLKDRKNNTYCNIFEN